METPIKEIADRFSRGAFATVYDNFSENIEWTLVGALSLSGKKSVVDHCEKMLVDMAGAVMTNTNAVVADNVVVIQGYCRYTGPDNSPGRVEYCDVYKFQNEQLAHITSYIIEVTQGS